MVLVTLPLILALIGIGGAVYYSFAETPYARVLGKYVFMISAMLATWEVYVISGLASWAWPLFYGQVGLILLFWSLDFFMPFFGLLKKLLVKK
jgi:hypothetical protein